MKSLPTLRRKILRSFLFLILLYAFLGFMLIGSVLISSKTTPKLIHSNYDSISAADRMEKAWSGLQSPDLFPEKSSAAWQAQFEEALHFEENNITENGEKEIARSIRVNWEKSKPRFGHLSSGEFREMRALFDRLTQINENGMFRLAQENEDWSNEILIGAAIYFVFSILLSIVLSDNLAQRLSQPLKNIAEALHRKPTAHRRLKLPEPNSLEVLILTTELQRLWERSTEAERVNIAEILAQKSKLETLLESVEDGLLVLDSNGVVSHCNQCILTLLGLPADQVQGVRWADLPTSSENYLKLRDLLRPGMPEGQDLELAWRGGAAQFSARSRKISRSDGGESGVLYLLHDITEKKQRDKFRSEFIDLLSHELKTPLQSLGTASELLCGRKEEVPADLRLMVDTISEDVERIRAVAQEFVQITQSQSKIMKLKLEPTPMNQILPEWLKPFSVIARDRGVRIQFEQEGSEVIWAKIDTVKFPWVISNLVSNAVRFSPKGGVVTVFLTDRNGSVEIRVKDQGPGVPEAEQQRIFEPFYQSSQGTRGFFGVGLTIAKEVVEAHDGRIEYYRLQPTGSEFRILLPWGVT